MRDPLRDVNVEGYRLETFDTGRTDRLGKCILAYKFSALDGTPLFEGEDFGCSPIHAIDSDEALRALLGFLTLKPGDTDAEYFEDYTPEQLAFAEGAAEQLQFWAMEPDEGFDLPVFVDWA